LSKRTMMNDKTIALIPFWVKVLAFCQFCQGLGLPAKRWLHRVEMDKGR